MKKNINILSDKFILDLRQATTGYLSSENFEKLINAFEHELKVFYFSASTEANLHRIIFSLYDKISFLSDCLKYPFHIQIVIAVAVNSNFLTDVIVRNPEFLSWILNPEILNQRITEKYIENDIGQTLTRYKTFNAKVNYLRTLKRRELLRIGLNDILGNTNVKETTELLSILAKGINSKLFSLCHNEVMAKYNLKISGSRYCLAALGKLGGDELNYSSDIDLLLFFDKNSVVKQNPRKEYFEILSEAAYLFVQSSTAITDKGYLYRVDFRLRPDGRNSPLCRTLKDYLQYYETRGEDWERQMLIKLSLVSGSKKLFESFNSYVQHFVYPSSFSNSPLSQIARIKNDIEKKVGEKENVKLFSGGIRDIEFSVQALQLLNGGKLKELRTGNSLTAIGKLREKNLLTEDESASLISAYNFYRKIEHFLQLMNDKQTHLVPEDDDTLNKLSSYLRFKDIGSFQKRVASTRKQIKKIFDSIVGKEEINPSSLDSIQFTERKKAIGNFKYLQTGQGLLEQKQFDKQAINSFQKIETTLFAFLSKSLAPDSVVENFARIIKIRPLPSIWYNEFTDTNFFYSFLKICERNKKAVELMVIDKSLGDLILNRRAFNERFDTIENFSTNQMIFILSVQFCLGIIKVERLSKILSEFLLAKIKTICKSFSLPDRFFIIALGSFGTDEMTFGSDVDLIFAVENILKYPNVQTEFQNLLLKLKEQLKPFDVDSRLRPEGKSSQLVWDVDKYFDYLENRAQTWELQSLTRIKFVYGSIELYNNFLEGVKKRVKFLEHSSLIKDILDMRSKMEKQLLSTSQAQFGNFFNIKRSRGGLADIEFIVQYQVLKNSESFSKLIGKNTKSAIKILIDFSENFNSFEALIENYSFLKKLEIWVQILFETNSKVIPLDNVKRNLLANVLNFKIPRDLEVELTRIKKANHDFFKKIFAI
ncbi:MAG: hypothetical protein NTX22_13845 [Ignavibacteriales bacterium]|nr:hypothetical protein [Ignavibacteriales bacterium]